MALKDPGLFGELCFDLLLSFFLLASRLSGSAYSITPGIFSSLYAIETVVVYISRTGPVPTRASGHSVNTCTCA